LDLTPEGNALMDAVFGDTRQWMARKFAPLTAEEIQAFLRTMESLKKVI
jgi:DNA-binding MarR family transcriptional regulator